VNYGYDPMTHYDYDSIPVGYYDVVFQQKRGVQSKWHQLKFERVANEFSSGSVHLDVGCGPGSFISTLPDDIDSTGVDVTNVQVEYARSKYERPGKRFRVISPGILPFRQDSFDIVTLLELVEHISAREAEVLLGEVFRVLRPRGKIVLTTPNYASLWPLLEILVDRFGGVAYADQHITKYVGSSFRMLITQAGFQDVRVETCLFSAPFLAALSWALADRVNRWESALVARRGGHLLIGTACKP